MGTFLEDINNRRESGTYADWKKANPNGVRNGSGEAPLYLGFTKDGDNPDFIVRKEGTPYVSGGRAYTPGEPLEQRGRQSFTQYGNTLDPSKANITTPPPSVTTQNRYSLAEVADKPDMTKIDLNENKPQKMTPEAAKQAYAENGLLNLEQLQQDDEEQRRRENLALGWSGIAQGLSGLANLYYTTKWAPSQKLDNTVGTVYNQVVADRKTRENQIRAMKEHNRARKEAQEDYDRQQDAAKATRQEQYAQQAKLAEISQAGQNARKEAQLEAEKEKNQYNWAMKLGLVDKNNQAAMDRLKANGQIRVNVATLNAALKKDIAKFRAESGGASGGKVKDTCFGSDGILYSGANKLSTNTMAQIVLDCGEGIDTELFRKQNGVDEYGNPKLGEVNWREAFNYIAEKGMIPPAALEAAGMKASGYQKDGATAAQASQAAQQQTAKPAQGSAATTEKKPTAKQVDMSSMTVTDKKEEKQADKQAAQATKKDEQKQQADPNKKEGRL
jgi:hypothetical protein